MLKQLIKIRLSFLMSTMFARMSRSGKKRSILSKALIGLLVLYVGVCLFFGVGMIFYGLGMTLAGTEYGWIYWAMAALMTVMFCFMGSVFITQQHVFNSKDNELLLSMPIRPGTILLSRLISLIGLNLLYTLFILLPATIAYGVVVRPGISVYITAIIGILLLPLLATALSCVFGYILAQITSRLRYKKLVTMVVTVGLFFGYMYACFNITNIMSALLANGESIANTVRRVLPPFYFFGMAAADGNILGLWQLALWSIVPFGIIFWLLKISFINIATAKKGEIKIKYKARSMTASSPFIALTKKELNRIFGTVIYMFNCAIGAVMEAIFGILILLKAPEVLAALSREMGNFDIAVFAVPIICLTLSFCSIMNCTSAVSISLEGNSFWVLKSLPLDTRTILGSKVAANLVIGIPPIVFAGICCCIAIPMSFIQGLLLFLVPLTVQIFTAFFGITANLWMPRFDWISESAVVKQSGSAMIAVFGGMAIIGAPSIAFLFINGNGVSFELFAAGFVLILALVTAGLYFYDMKIGQKMIDNM